MRTEVDTSGLAETIRALNALGRNTRKAIATGMEDAGETIRNQARDLYRVGGRGRYDLTRTAKRTGNLYNAYRSRVTTRGRLGIVLDVGVLQPVAGKVLKYARIHEGGDRVDNLRSFTTIKAKRAHQVNYVTRRGKAVSFSIKALHFPIRRGSGQAQAGIIGWRFAKEVDIPARPAIFSPTLQAQSPGIVTQAIRDELNELLANEWR